MATGGLYGSSPTGATVAAPGSESAGLYGNGTTFGGSYFEWFIFIQSATQPATPTGGSWSFQTNSGTPPSGWSVTPPSAPTLPVWVSIALVNSRDSAALTWSAPGLFAYASGLPILSGSGEPSSGTGLTDQLYIQTNTTPETIWFKQAGTWTRLTGSSLYVDLTTNQTIAGTKTFSSPIAGSVTGTSANVTGIVGIVNGGTGSTTANGALTALGGIGSLTSTDGTVTITSPTATSRDLSVVATTNVVCQVRNTTGATLTKGTVVYISGATGQLPTVSKALATSDATSAQTLGMISADLANNTNGNVTVIGLITDIDTSAYTDGQQLYLSGTTAGTVTATKPYAPIHLVYVAVVEHAHPTQGKLFVKVQNGYELDEIHNVSAQTPSNGQTIVYNSSNSLWENNTVSLTLGVNGTLPVANGGTGQTTANAAFNALAPSQTGNSGKYLTTDGSNTSWASNPLGTVTSVAATVPSFLSISGSPITTSGTLAFGLSGTALPTTSGGTGLTSFTSGGVVYASSTSALATGSALTFDGTTLAIGGTSTASPLYAYKYAGFVATFDRAGDYGQSLQLIRNGVTGNAGIGLADQNQFGFYINTTEYMRLTTTGLGIGTSSPSGRLHILQNSTSNTTPALRITGSSGDPSNYYMEVVPNLSSATVNYRFNVKNVSTFNDVLVLSGNGNVGIGTSSPTTKLHLAQSNAGNYASVILLSNTAADAGDKSGIYGSTAVGNASPYRGGITFHPGDFGKITFHTGNNATPAAGQVMELNVSGNLGLGVTPSASSSKTFEIVSVGNTITSTGSNEIQSSAGAYYNSGWKYAVSSAAVTNYYQGGGQHIWRLAGSSTAGSALTWISSMTLGADGNLLVGTTTNTNTSKLVVNGTISQTVGGTQYLVVDQSDIGTGANEIPLNQYLGNLAYEDNTNLPSVGVGAGTAALPSIFNATDNDTGLWFPAANTIAASVNGAESLRLTTTGLGIGTSSPAYKLDVIGNGNFTSLLTLAKGSSQGLTIGDVATNSNSVLRMQGTSAGYNWQIANNLNASGLEFTPSTATGGTTYTTPAMALTTTGLGIGTSSPSNAKLVVSGTSAGTVGAIMSVDTASTTSFLRMIADLGSQNLINWQDGTALRFATSTQAYGTFNERMRITSAGNLGLGVTPSAWSSSYKALQLTGGAVQSYLTGYISVGQNNYDSGTGAWKYVNTGFATRYQQGDGTHQWFNAASGTAGNAISFTQAMTLDASGRLLLGNTSILGGTNLASFSNSVSAKSVLAIQNTSTSGYSSVELYNSSGTQTGAMGYGNASVAVTGAQDNVYLYSASAITFLSGGTTERARIDSSGNLGVGTSSPSTFGTFAVKTSLGSISIASGGSIGARLKFYDSSNTQTAEIINNGGSNELLQISATAATGSILFNTNSAERARIDSSGNLLVGTTSGGYQNSNSIAIQPLALGAYVITNHANGTVSGREYSIFTYNASAIGSITQNGTTAVAYNTSSDYRLKNSIAPMTGALAKVALLKPCTYKWNVDGSDGEGFIAHELAEVVPQCVTGEKDAVDEEGNPKYQGIDTSFLVATLTAAIQEQQAIIQQLQADVAALKG